jgi:hypothetical protein
MMDYSATQDSPGRRAASYWFVDGFPDIVFGLAVIVSGAVGLVWLMYAPGASPAAVLIIGVAVYLHHRVERPVLNFLKSHFTYPRTGYVQPPKDEEPERKEYLISLSLRPSRPVRNENVTSFRRRTVATIWWIFYAFSQEPSRWVAPLVLVVLAILLYMVNRKSEHPYSWWSALILALMGVLLFGSAIPPVLGLAIGQMLTGAWLVGQGLATLIGYVRANPYPPAPEGMQA